MSELVRGIESIVGVPRHAVEHIGIAVSSSTTMYIMHSKACVDSGIDLRDCPYSVALDTYGIDEAEWGGYEDKPVVLTLLDDYILAPREEATDA
jgi:hypothetical protein